MKTAQQWLDEMQEDQTAACVHYEIHKQMGPSISMLEWIERIQHDAQDDFTNQVAELKAENARLAEERNQAIQLQAMAQSDRARMEAAYGELRLLRCCVHDDMPGLLVEIERHLASLHEGATGMSLEESDTIGQTLLARLRAAREGK